MYNRLTLLGNLTRDIELRYLPSGQPLAKGGIATNRRYKDASGQQKDETMFIDFTIWGRSAEVANQYLRKGSRVLLEGRLVLEQWTDQQGQKRSKHTMHVETMKMLDGKSEGQGASQGYGQSGSGYGGQPQQAQPYGQPQQGYGAAAPQSAAQQAPQAMPQPTTAPEPALPEIDIDEDDIPF